MGAKITVQPFGEWEGRSVNKYIITETAGIQVSVINYGATVTSIIVPDRNGSVDDVVLGFDTLDEYINAGSYYVGGICGRYANRIAGASFRINGSMYNLAGNNGIHCLHGGFKGFDKVYWSAAVLPGEEGVAFTYTSKDGEEGFPGTMITTVTYRVENHSLHITYSAVTDKATPVNLTSHCYFNLSGSKQADILDHELQINADNYLEVDTSLIPTGYYRKVEQTAMDFRIPRTAGEALQQLNGFDHCWILDKKNEELIKAAGLFHQKSGRMMTVYTTQPGIHFYSGHLLDGGLQHAKGDTAYGKYAGLCLEAQHFPDSPNHPEFPGTILYPGETYREQTIYSFSTDTHKFVKTKPFV
jgi:aldose 1-epimerase